MCCPDCDAGQEVRAGARVVAIVAGQLICGTCGRSELVPAPRGGPLECPSCDTPPWEREQVGQPAVVQTSIPEVDDLVAPDDRKGKADGPARPDSVVRTCFFCRQRCWQDYVWRQVKWVAVCRGCGNRLSDSRVKVTRAKARKGARG